ncbi:protease complex subunit PrcB family protein [Marinimicrobium alkaliphilum]|uniref:protease complex subunit PrcB family protein n=1 Tax=Marinimicrobium alkaliphilum TaxID=2202654 RepID=UPI000DB995BE|nr:protease complex subunit PrcB family protein [Marinimicrobium alkaliphilum]
MTQYASKLLMAVLLVVAGAVHAEVKQAEADALPVCPDCRPIPTRELASGFYTQHVVTKRFLLAKDENRLREISRLIGTSLDVDLERYMVLAVFMGERPTGGYNISVERVVATRNHLLANVLNTSPGEACPVTLAITSPYQVVAIPRHEIPLHLTERDELLVCP